MQLLPPISPTVPYSQLSFAIQLMAVHRLCLSIYLLWGCFFLPNTVVLRVIAKRAVGGVVRVSPAKRRVKIYFLKFFFSEKFPLAHHQTARGLLALTFSLTSMPPCSLSLYDWTQSQPEQRAFVLMHHDSLVPNSDPLELVQQNVLVDQSNYYFSRGCSCGLASRPQLSWR